MNSSGRSSLMVVAIVLCLLAPLALAAGEPTKRVRVAVPYDGPELFARLLDHAGLTPIDSTHTETAVRDENKIVIVFGDCDLLVRRESKVGDERLSTFLARGGALLIASDRPFSFAQIPGLGWDDLRITGATYTNAEDRFKYRGEWSCPLLRPQELGIKDGQIPSPPAEIVAGIKRSLFARIKQPIALNCPSALAGSTFNLRPIAYLPEHSLTLDETFAPPRKLPYLAAGDNERVLVVAGHGVFTNCMMAQDDIDNRQFALNVINWLKQGKRTHVEFLVNREAVTNFKPSLVGPPVQLTPSFLNRQIGNLERSGFFEWFLERWIPPERAFRMAVLAGTLGIFLYGLKKYFQSRQTLEATPAPLGAPPPPPRPLVEQQVREMAFREQLGEPARELARDWFRTYAGVEFSGGQPPAELSFNIHAGFLERRALTSRTEMLWRLATNPAPADFDSRTLRALAISIEQLSLAVGAGHIAFDMPAGANVIK